MMKISSDLTKFSKVLIILLGIPISATIPFQTGFVWWAVLLFILMAGFCIYFSLICADAFLSEGLLKFVSFFGKETNIDQKQILKVKRFRSRKHLYFYFSTAVGNFLVIAPMWGDGRQMICDLYERNLKS